MEKNECLHEDTLKRIAKDLYGNGGKGIVKDLEVIKTKVNIMDERSKKIETSLSGINKFVGSVETELNNIKANCNQKRVSTSQQVTQVIMMLGILATILISLFV